MAVKEVNYRSFGAFIPARVLWDETLNFRQKVLFGCIQNLANERGYCWASNKYLGECLDVHPMTISKDVQTLKESGLVTPFEEVTEAGSHRRLLLTPLSQMTQTPKSNDLPPPKSSDLPYKNNIDNNSNNIEFNKFWDLYGHKKDRFKCQKKFSKLKSEEIKKIFEVLPSYVESTPDLKYRKYPLTWLNGKCWEDELEPKQKHFLENY